MYCLTVVVVVVLLGSVPTTRLRLRDGVHLVHSCAPSRPAENDATGPLLPVPCVAVAERRVHVRTKKKSMPMFMRLLRKSTIRPEGWSPHLSSSVKLFRSPHASAETAPPVTVNW